MIKLFFAYNTMLSAVRGMDDMHQSPRNEIYLNANLFLCLYMDITLAQVSLGLSFCAHSIISNNNNIINHYHHHLVMMHTKYIISNGGGGGRGGASNIDGQYNVGACDYDSYFIDRNVCAI